MGGAAGSADAPGAELAKGGGAGADTLRTGPLPHANHGSLRTGRACMSWACPRALLDCQREKEGGQCFCPTFQMSHEFPVSGQNYVEKEALGNVAPVY